MAITMNSAGWFACGFLGGALTAVGVIAVLDYFEDRKKTDDEAEECEVVVEKKEARVTERGSDRAGERAGDPFEINLENSCIVVPYKEESEESDDSEAKEDSGRRYLAGNPRAGKVDYTRYYTDTLSNEISEEMADPLINPASLLEKDESELEVGDDGSLDTNDITKEEGLLGQFFRDPSEDIPSCAEYLSYFKMDHVLCFDDDIQKAMALESIFTVPIASAIKVGAENDESDKYVVIDAKKAKTYVVNVYDGFWSDLPMY